MSKAIFLKFYLMSLCKTILTKNLLFSKNNEHYDCRMNIVASCFPSDCFPGRVLFFPLAGPADMCARPGPCSRPPAANGRLSCKYGQITWRTANCIEIQGLEHARTMKKIQFMVWNPYLRPLAAVCKKSQPQPPMKPHRLRGGYSDRDDTANQILLATAVPMMIPCTATAAEVQSSRQTASSAAAAIRTAKS